MLKIPLPRASQLDQPLWHYDKSSNYSVKSSYQVALKIEFPNCPSSSSSTQTSWNAIWTLGIPEKVKIFTWTVKNLLPTVDNHWRRKSVQDPLCKRCGRTSETTYHVLFECRASQKTWKLTPVRETIRGLIHQNMMDILYELKRSNNTNELEMIVTVCWAIWHSRNLFVFERKRENFRLSVARSKAILDSYRRIQAPKEEWRLMQQPTRQQTWNPPPESYN